MNKNAFYLAGCLCLSGMVFSCGDKSTGPATTPAFIGHWASMDTVMIPGHQLPDSYWVDLNITKADSKYTLSRNNVKRLSYSPIIDSAWESGTWSQNGNQIVLTPSHWKYLIWDYSNYPATGTLRDTVYPPDIQNRCYTPKILENSATDNSWTIRLAQWLQNDTITYHLKKLAQ
jgi:hypothetical protein